MVSIRNNILTFIVVPLLLVGIGWQAHKWYQNHYEAHDPRRVRQAGFRFISPLLDVELPEGYSVRNEPIPFKYKIKNYVNQQVKSGTVKEMSVYFRDLSDGPWFGINEKLKFDPASMMKVPIMIAWLKRAEKDPSVLQQSFVFDENRYQDVPQNIKPAKSLTSGAQYTVEDLLRYMLNYSDNRATWLLYRNMDSNELNHVLDSMDVTSDPSDVSNATSVHGYSGFFRILYNASFLNREMSEKALQLLSLQDFPQGIAAGVPKDIPVAAKYGEKVQGTDKQLHEFGIVYHPKGPYILGIMTRGYDLAVQTEILKSVSSMIYTEVNSNISTVPGK